MFFLFFLKSSVVDLDPWDSDFFSGSGIICFGSGKNIRTEKKKLIDYKVFFFNIISKHAYITWVGSGTLKMLSWIRIKSFRIHNDAQICTRC